MPSTRLIVSVIKLDPADRVRDVDAVHRRRPVRRSDRDPQLARDREHRDRGLARVDPHEQHLVGVRHDEAARVALRRWAAVVADQQQRLGGARAGGREDLRRELHGPVLVERFDDLAHLTERDHGGRPTREQNHADRPQDEAFGHPPAPSRRLRRHRPGRCLAGAVGSRRRSRAWASIMRRSGCPACDRRSPLLQASGEDRESRKARRKQRKRAGRPSRSLLSPRWDPAPGRVGSSSARSSSRRDSSSWGCSAGRARESHRARR